MEILIGELRKINLADAVVSVLDIIVWNEILENYHRPLIYNRYDEDCSSNHHHENVIVS